MTTKNLKNRIKKRVDSFLKRRPYRSFRLTRRRDYKRSLKLPGYFSFTAHVAKTIWTNRKTFTMLAVLYAVMTALLVGMASQDTYNILKDILTKTSGGIFGGDIFGEVGKAGLLFVSSTNGGISQNLTEVQQVYTVVITLITWLTGVWLLRNILAGHKVKMRDGLYNSGAPIVSSFIIVLVFILQLLPVAFAFIGYSAASLTGLLAGGVESMLFWIAAALLATLSLYWVTSTFFALIIVTLPGMYPYKALRTAGDLVVGRRFRILLRFLWMAATVLVSWTVVMIPTIIVDSWLKGIWPAINWVPIVPIFFLALTSLTVIWVSSYVYLLYRKVVADDAEPA